MNGRMNGRTDGWSGTSVPAWDKRLSAMSHNVPRTKRDKRPHMGQTRRAGFRPMSAATVRRLSVIPPPSPHIDTLYATKRRNVKNIFSFPHSRRPFDRGEHRTPRHHRTRRADSGQCRRILPAVRATIAGNAPQPPALAFLRAAHVRDRHAVPRPCKAVFTRFASVRKSGKDSGKPSASLSGNAATVRPWRTSNAATVRASPATFGRIRRHHRTRRRKRPRRFSPATVRPCAPDSSATYPASRLRPSATQSAQAVATVRPCRNRPPVPANVSGQPIRQHRTRRPLAGSVRACQRATVRAAQPFAPVCGSEVPASRPAGFATIAGNAAQTPAIASAVRPMSAPV